MTAQHTTNGDEHRELLEINGYRAIAQTILSIPADVMNIPTQAFDAAIKYAESKLARVKLSTEDNRDAQVAGLTAELDLMRATKKYRAALADIADRLEARAKLGAKS